MTYAVPAAFSISISFCWSPKQMHLVDYVFSTSAKGRDPKRDSVRLRRKAVELSIPCITAVDTANALVNCLRSEHSMKDIPLVDIATLYHKK